MKNTINTRFANALFIAILLMVFTMVLHPMGGSIEYIQKISAVIMITHTLAILSVPFWILGFWGLSKYLDDDSLISRFAFIVMGLGLLAVVLAATVNGLILPLYVNHYPDATPEKISSIKPIVVYNGSLNHAFDLVYIVASCLAVLCWSVAILKTKKLPLWLAWFGILLSLSAFIPVGSGLFFVSLTGFRIFVSGYVIWAILVVISLRRQSRLE